MKSELLKIQTVLKLTFIIIPIVAGADKLTNLLVNWSIYLNPLLSGKFPFSDRIFMLGVGVVEIGAGLLVWVDTKLGAWVLVTWFVLLTINLCACGHYYDVAARDLVMGAGAYALAVIAGITEAKPVHAVA
jgi:hypothetical protein